MSNQPDYKAFNVVNRKNKDDFWNRLGGAFKFQTDDGREGISIPAMNIVLLEPKPEDENSAVQTQEQSSETTPEVGM